MSVFQGGACLYSGIPKRLGLIIFPSHFFIDLIPSFLFLYV